MQGSAVSVERGAGAASAAAEKRRGRAVWKCILGVLDLGGLGEGCKCRF